MDYDGMRLIVIDWGIPFGIALAIVTVGVVVLSKREPGDASPPWYFSLMGLCFVLLLAALLKVALLAVFTIAILFTATILYAATLLGQRGKR